MEKYESGNRTGSEAENEPVRDSLSDKNEGHCDESQRENWEGGLMNFIQTAILVLLGLFLLLAAIWFGTMMIGGYTDWFRMT